MNQGLQVSPAVFIKQLKPVQLIFAILAYILGAGAADYLGELINWEDFWIGLVIVILFMSFSNYLKAYFDFFDPKEYVRSYVELENYDPTGRIVRHTSAAFLITALASLTCCVGLFVLLEKNGSLNLSVAILLGFVLVITIANATPPLRLAYSGYGELTQTILITNLIPALAFLFQVKQLHRLIAMVSFPISLLFLAMTIAISLKDYAADIKFERKTLLSMLGWKKGLLFHNILIFSAYCLIGIAMGFGLPWKLVWPFIITIPIALFQIGTINSIQGGSVPRWKILTLSSYTLTTFGLYLVAFSLWIG